MKNKKIWVGVIGLVLVAALMLTVYALLSPKGMAGEKRITVTMIHGQSEKTQELRTDEAYLGGALEEQKLIAGEQGPYGMYVKTVDGVTADEAKQEWWCLTKGGETVMTGVDTTPIADGDAFEITLTVGY